MARRLAIIGQPNSGKSFSRRSIERGEDVFIIAPSAKAMHIKTSDGKPLKRLNPENKIFEELYPKLTPAQTMSALMTKDLTGKVFVGNYIVSPLENVLDIMKFVNVYMPNIKTIILPDFTHFISKVLADESFIKRKNGGEAFQRFWELAGKTMDNLLLSIDNLREDLIVVTEYHTEYSEIEDEFQIFTPGGKMLTEKFKLDSYYDYAVYTYIEKNETEEVGKNDYKFITRRWGKYPARMSELFEETFIPNDLELVLTRMREEFGI